MAWISFDALPCRGEKINPLNAELNPTCHLLALLGAHHILHVSRIKVNDSPCLDFVEIARGPDMLLSSFPSWSGLRTYQHPDIAAVKETIIKNSSFCRQLNSEFFWNLSRRIRLIESASVVTCLSGGQTQVAPRHRDTQTFMWVSEICTSSVCFLSFNRLKKWDQLLRIKWNMAVNMEWFLTSRNCKNNGTWVVGGVVERWGWGRDWRWKRGDTQKCVWMYS